MTDETLDRDPVENLAEEFVARHRDGEFPSIEEYARRYPDLADEIRDLFPTIARLERLKLEKSGSSNGRASSGLSMLTQLGDFRIVKEVGRGGMGIVYEAEQLSLKRRVALKVLGANIAGSTKQYRRFQREAEAAARLHHTNIVPIFGIGEEHGIHFFAMQLIEGAPLSEIIELRASKNGNSTGHPTCSEDETGLQEDSRDAPSEAAPSIEGGRSDVNGENDRYQDGKLAAVTETVIDSTSAHSSVGISTDDVVPLAEPNAKPACDMGHASAGRQAGSSGVDGRAMRDQGFRVTLVTSSTGDPIPRVIVSQGNPTLRTAADVPGWKTSRDVARIGSVLADALAYAHSHGVLHRDVKPANILMDREGVVYMTDFGLARHLDQAGLTNTGDVLGTLRYMAPEQFHGASDERADIYSLGLTIYEMLADRPAFTETQQGPLIQQKGTHHIPSLRSLNPAVPRDLETIVMKACAAEPLQRYRTAHDLAADLNRFIEDRPIIARRSTLFERSWRWVRRNRMVAALGSLAIVLLATVAIAFGVGNYRTNQALGRVDQERSNALNAARLARQEAARAEANMLLAVQAFDEIIQNVSSRGVPQSLHIDVEGVETSIPETVVTDADAELLTSLLRFFDKFAAENGADFSAETANARRRIGDIQLRLGKLDESEEAYQEALDSFAKLREGDIPSPVHVLDAAKTWNQVGVVRSRRGDFWGAISAHREAFGLLEDSGIVQTTDAAKLELAETINLIGSVGARSGALDLLAEIDWRHPESFGHRGPPDGRRGEGRPPERRPPNGRPFEGRSPDGRPPEGRPFDNRSRGDNRSPSPESAVDGSPTEPGPLTPSANVTNDDQGDGRGRRGPDRPPMMIAAGEGPPPPEGRRGAPPEFSPMLPWNGPPWEIPGRAIPAAAPDEPGEGVSLNRPGNGETEGNRLRGRPGSGGVPFNVATEMLQQLVDAHPENPEYRLALARSYRNLMIWSSQRGFFSGESKEQESATVAIRLLEQLIADFPDSPEYQFELADTLCLSVRAGRKEQRPEQIKTLRRAVDIAEGLLKRHPQINEYQALLGGAERKLGAMLYREGQDVESGASYQRAVELQRPLADRFPMVSIHQVAFAQALAGQADLLQRIGQHEAATAARAEALQIAEATLSRRQEDHFLRRFVEKLTRDQNRPRMP